jgi:hypothetical protein
VLPHRPDTSADPHVGHITGAPPADASASMALPARSHQRQCVSASPMATSNPFSPIPASAGRQIVSLLTYSKFVNKPGTGQGQDSERARLRAAGRPQESHKLAGQERAPGTGQHCALPAGAVAASPDLTSAPLLPNVSSCPARLGSPRGWTDLGATQHPPNCGGLVSAYRRTDATAEGMLCVQEATKQNQPGELT